MSPLNPDVEATARSVTLPVDEAVEQAAVAAEGLRELAPEERAHLLEHIADALDAAKAELVAVAMRETSLPETRLLGEVDRTTGQLRLFADVLRDGACLEVTIDHADPDASPPRPDLRRYLRALGPVAVFTASNFPFAFSVAGGDTASALAAGCPVVVKAHPAHIELSRATAAVVQAALRDAGAPEGTLTHIEGHEAGRQVVLASEIRAVGFTGSLEGGRALFDLATGRDDPIPFYGELGSLNPVVITPGAAAERTTEIAQGLVESFTLGVGQFCTKPGVVFVPADCDLVPALTEHVAHSAPSKMLVDRITQGFVRAVGDLADVNGVDVVSGTAEQAADGAVTPVILATDTHVLLQRSDQLLRECFGPAVLLVSYDDRDALEAALELLPGSLTTALHASDDELQAWRPIVDVLQSLSGRVILNGWPTGVAVTWAMHHGGPWPSTTAPLHTSVGPAAIRRFLRPVAFQSAPTAVLPPALQDDNPWNLPRRVDGQWHQA